MATKTISITEEAYRRLKALGKPSESFTEVINRLTNKINLLDYAGILTEEEANNIEKRIKESRKASKARMERIKKEMSEIDTRH